jgi:nitrite reductase (NADH) large subunit
VDLARNAGLEVRRGIVVGDDLRCPDDANVYALGECSEHRGLTYGLVAPLWDQARVLAERLTATRPDAVYTGSRVATKLKVAGVELSVMGEHAAREGDEEIHYVEHARGIYKKLLVREGRLAGAILLGETSRGAHLLQLFDRGTEVPESRAELPRTRAARGWRTFPTTPRCATATASPRGSSWPLSRVDAGR